MTPEKRESKIRAKEKRPKKKAVSFVIVVVVFVV